MLVDITYSCKMGCDHCLSDCKPDGEHMTLDTFNDTMDFMIKNMIPAWTFTGGEMFEHPDILTILDIISDRLKGIYDGPVTFITNGRELARNREIYEAVSDFQKKRKKKSLTIIQVTDDPRFYKDPLTKKEIYRLQKLDAFIDTVPGDDKDLNKCLYPQGRALENYSEEWWRVKGPKCANCVLIAKQYAKTFTQLVYTLLSTSKFCTPVIAPDGSIKLGESALCPAVASIYNEDSVIIDKIKNHKCKACKIAWDSLKEVNPTAYEMLK